MERNSLKIIASLLFILAIFSLSITSIKIPLWTSVLKDPIIHLSSEKIIFFLVTIFLISFIVTFKKQSLSLKSIQVPNAHPPLDTLMFLRIFSILLVFYEHFCQKINIPYPGNSWGSTGWGYFLFSNNANFGMKLFFITSGFLMGRTLIYNYSLNIKGISQFYISRAIRIFPGLVILQTIAMVINLGIEKLGFAFLFSIIKPFSPSYTYMSMHLWSIIIELFFYLIVPFILFIFLVSYQANKKIFFWLSVYLFIFFVWGFSYYLITIRNGLWDYVYFGFLSNIPYFIAGLLGNFILKEILHKINWKFILFSFIFFILSYFMNIFFLIKMFNGDIFSRNIIYFAIPIIVSVSVNLFIFSLIHINNQYQHSFWLTTPVARIINYIGVLIYPLYLFHVIILDSYTLFSPNKLSQFIGTEHPHFIVFTILVIVFASVFHETVERPLEKLKRVLFKKLF